MIPPVSEAILQNNPEFATLHKTLTTSILNPDGSTKNDPAAKARKAVREELDAYRVKAAKEHILTEALSTASPQTDSNKPTRRGKPHQHDTSSELPAELLDLLVLLPPLLDTTTNNHNKTPALSPDSTRLLLSNPPFSALASLLPRLAPLVSTNLHASAVLLARIANPSTNPSYLHRAVPALPAHAAAQRARLADLQASLAAARLAAAGALCRLLARHARALAGLVRALETKHGAAARSLELRADEAALTASRAAADAAAALAAARREAYTPDARAALRNYAAHLRDGRARLAEAARSLAGELALYGVDVGGGGVGDGVDEARERTMREMARVHRDMERQVEEVKRDLERLGRR